MTPIIIGPFGVMVIRGRGTPLQRKIKEKISPHITQFYWVWVIKKIRPPYVSYCQT